MIRSILILALGLLRAFSQAPEGPDAEEKHLSTALGESGSSPLELIRAIENHLAKFPDSKRKPELERALVKAAIENKDQRRTLLYGERVLQREPDDIQVLDKVIRVLLPREDQQSSEKVLKYARRYEELVTTYGREKAPVKMAAGQWQNEIDRGLGWALHFQGRATGNLGHVEEAIGLARRSYQAFPNAQSAREIARWLVKAGKPEEAIRHLADAFTIVDDRNTDAERAQDRAAMGELYRKLKGSEKGLGDLVLEAYDRTSALKTAQRERLRRQDPNAQLASLMEFTLSGLNTASLQLAALKGKTVIFDFWATWCGPCRIQHPLYEEVKRRFAGNPRVVFLSVNTDEDRNAVQPFLRDNKWTQTVYLEDGLSSFLQVGSIPTTIIVNGRGEVVSRMNGFVPHRFVDMLSERIREALKN